MSEAEYLSSSIRRTLAGASSAARQAAMASIIGGLRPEELSELEELARRPHPVTVAVGATVVVAIVVPHALRLAECGGEPPTDRTEARHERGRPALVRSRGDP